MPDEQKNAVPLNYARPELRRARARDVNRGLDRGSLDPDSASAVVYETLDRADMAAACRRLGQRAIAFRVADGQPQNGAYKRPLILSVQETNRDAAIRIVSQVINRRERAKALNRKPEGFRTHSEGGTWPDPLDNHLDDVGPFGTF